MSDSNPPPVPNGPSAPFQSTGPVSKTPSPIIANEQTGSVAGKVSEKWKEEAVPDPGQQSDEVGRAELDAKIAAAEARTGTTVTSLQGEMRVGFAELKGEMRLILERTDSIGRDVKTSRQWVIGTLIAVSLAVAGIVFAVGQGTVSAVMSDRANILSAIQTTIGLTQKETPAANTPSTPGSPGAPAPRP
jgi:hypothetical protein